MKKVAIILMPTVRRFPTHVGALKACFELYEKGILPRPYIIIGVSAGAAAGACFLPWTKANSRTAANVLANLEASMISSLPWSTKILIASAVITTLFPVANFALRKALSAKDGGNAEKFSLDLGETLTSWFLIGALQYFFWKGESVFSPNKLRWLFSKGPERGGLDLAGILNSDILFEIIATNLETGHEAVFTNYREEDRDPKRLVEALLASTAIAGSLPPSKIDGQILADGGISSRLPLHRAVHHGVDAIVVFAYHSVLEEEKGPFSWPACIVRSTEISEAKASRLTFENYQLRSQLGENLPPLFRLTTEEKLPNVSLRNFTKSDMVEAMNIGYRAVYSNLEELQKICC